MSQMSRRSILKGGAIAAGASMIGVHQMLVAASPSLQFASDLEILNYALTLERLEFAFYRDGLNVFGASDFARFNRLGGIDTFSAFAAIRDHEGAHVQTLVQVIQSLGGTPVPECSYNFGYTDATSFVAIARALENTGVSAYDGAIRFVQSPDLREASATIATVEARHAAYLNLLNGASPFPAAFDTPLSQAEVLAIAGPFIVGCPGTGTVNTPAANQGQGQGNANANFGITSPTANQVVTGPIAINGSVNLGPNDAFYKVEIMGGQFGTNWVTVGQTRSSSVANGQLEFLNQLQPGTYMLRVVVVGRNSNFTQTSNTVTFTVQ